MASLSNNRVTRYLKEVRAEIRKVTWPSRNDVVRLTAIVMIVLMAMSAFMAITDYGFSQLMRLIIRVGTGQ
jgi:preprotein translocase subunit SecE